MGQEAKLDKDFIDCLLFASCILGTNFLGGMWSYQSYGFDTRDEYPPVLLTHGNNEVKHMSFSVGV